MTVRLRALKARRQVIQFLCRQRAVPSCRCSSCRMPRLPIKRPRADEASISPKGVTRFCSGMGSVRSAERGLVEAAELARMERRALAAQDIQRREADHQVLADGAFVEGVGGPGQLNLAVQRLVGDAEQGSVRNA